MIALRLDSNHLQVNKAKVNRWKRNFQESAIKPRERSRRENNYNNRTDGKNQKIMNKERYRKRNTVWLGKLLMDL